MKAYKVKDLSTERVQHFRYMHDMCDDYGWDFDVFRKKRRDVGLPMGQLTDGGYCVISQIDIL